MTGYGKGVAEGYERKVTIEMKAVNHRTLDLIIKTPRGFSFCDDMLRKTLSEYFYRGHIEVYVNYEDNRQNKEKVSCDTELALQYMQVAKELEQKGFVNDMTVSHVLRMPDVLKAENIEDDEEIVLELVLKAARIACENLQEMR